MPRLFLSHASEDKKSFVRPLAHSLRARGLEVWYDEFSLSIGDSLRRSIDRGLADCDAGIVVLSPAFFAKHWPQAELDALYSAELAGRSKLLPIWHDIDHAGLLAHSPLLADRVALRSSEGIQLITSVIAKKLGVPEIHSCKELAEILSARTEFQDYADEAFAAGCHFRFLQMNAFKEEYQRVLENAVSPLRDQTAPEFPPELDEQLEAEQERLRRKHRLPLNVYLTTDEPIRAEDRAWYNEAIGEWAAGTLTRKKSAAVVHQLDLDELDEFYILLGVPNYEVSFRQGRLLERALIDVGCACTDGFEDLVETANALCSLDGEDA